jgi:hypothetical protein
LIELSCQARIGATGKWERGKRSHLGNEIQTIGVEHNPGFILLNNLAIQAMEKICLSVSRLMQRQ